ncbi:uncharacterized protein [Amphiura filiformis]|uniref:uncharacterized protein n=1 Tax=Amphiura filiformis TaxID=82378 RepID=UPI003B21D646
MNMTRKRHILTFLLGTVVGLIPFVLHGGDISSTEYSEQISEWQIGNSDENQRFSLFDFSQKSRQRKFFLDCGANTASSVEFFRNTYPDGRDYIIHSFEIDQRLCPYFSPYQNLHLHCPVAVSFQNGYVNAFTESGWSRDRGLNNGRDMQWGGGTLFVTDEEYEDVKTGGTRKLSVRTTIPTIDLSLWIQQNTRKDDYVILKLDVEGAEFDILNKMMEDGTFQWIDRFYGEMHAWQPVPGWTHQEKISFGEVVVEETGVISMLDWEAETRNYDDFKDLHPVKVPRTEPGRSGNTYSFCGKTTNKLALTIGVGMNAKRARKIIAILASYPIKIPVMLFVYGDFAELFPHDVKRWANRFDIGMREDGYYPSGHFEMLDLNLVMESLVSAELRLQEIGIQPMHYLPMDWTPEHLREAWRRGLRVITPAVEFPPKQGVQLTEENYYQYRDVERIPKALRILDTKLNKTRGGVLTLDTDVPDTRLNLVFLLDYLTQTSGYNFVSVSDCVASYDGCVGDCPRKSRGNLKREFNGA